MTGSSSFGDSVNERLQPPGFWAALLHCDLLPLHRFGDHTPDLHQHGVIYRAMLVLMVFAASVIALEGLFFGQLSPLLVAGSVALWFTLSATLLRQFLTGGILLPPVVTLTATLGLVLAATASGAQHHRLWLFPLLIAVASLLPMRVALPLGLAVLSVVVMVRGESLANFDIAEDSALIATWLLSLSVIRLLNRDAEEISEVALTDPLTGAFNRRYLLPQADRCIADYERYGRLSSLVIIDVDHFAKVNSQLGRAIGDHVLKDMVRVIEDRLRGVDRVFRIGGEEFAILMAEAGAQSAASVAEELRRSIAALGSIPGSQITVSIGVCDVSPITTTQDWLARAGEALLRAQTEGRNRVVAMDSRPTAHSHISSTMPIWR